MRQRGKKSLKWLDLLLTLSVGHNSDTKCVLLVPGSTLYSEEVGMLAVRVHDRERYVLPSAELFLGVSTVRLYVSCGRTLHTISAIG